MAPTDTLRRMRDELTRLSQLPMKPGSCEYCHDNELVDDPMGDDDVCVGCLRDQIDSLRDFMRDPGPAPFEPEDDPDVCERCGQRGFIKGTDMKCRSPECTADWWEALEIRHARD